VIGSVDDVSGTFYNPGAVAQASDLAFAVSTDVFEYSSISLEDGGGSGVDLGTATSGLRPSLVAGTIERGLLGGGGILAYSALTRTRGTQDLAGAVFLTAEDLPPAATLDDVVGSAEFTGRYSDFWAGLTYSQALGAHVGVGVTWYGAVRSQNRQEQSTATFIDNGGSGLSDIDNASGRYTAFRTLFKIGGFFQAGSVTGGATLTTPSIHITGSGELGVNESLVGADTTALLAGIQTDLPAQYKSPLSIGGGLAWQVGPARLHGSLEWFDGIDPYVVIQGEEIRAQEPESRTEVLDAVHEQTEALNWALGAEYQLSDTFTGYLSYYRDNSTLDDDIDRAGLSIIPIDINNLTVGTDFVVRSARLTLGLGYGWGSQVDRELTDLLREESEAFQATYVYRSLRLLFGFEIGVN
ncbi:MAG: hypothetical protein M8866_08495, partial [marine benthic group bacterium]|nr:hypothetical protein [Candidatus Benthicola marisminoris]